MYIEYIVLAALVVILAVKLSYYVDALDKKTKLSGAFIGGVLLAAVTSLPELFTALTAILVLDKPQLVQGDILGSNVFNLCVIAGLLLFYSRGYMKAKLSNSHRSTLWYGLIMYLFAFLAILKPIDINLGFININLMTILIMIVYAINVKFMKNDESAENESEDNIDLSVKQVVLRFVVCSLLLVAVSVLLTQVTDRISHDLNLGATVAGALFLGIATSLPELSASVNLVRIGNYNASFGNIVGSNLFNFTILCFADVLYTRGGIYIFENQVVNLIVFGALSSVFTLCIIKFKQKRGIILSASVAILVSYVLSIALSM